MTDGLTPAGAGAASPRLSLRPFWAALVLLNMALVSAGAVYASEEGIPTSLAVPIVLAFLWQASVYLAPGFPAARTWLESRFTKPQLASLAVLVSVCPYVIYSVPTGVFSWASLGKLLALCLVIAYTFVLFPARLPGLRWQDIVVLGALAYPMVSGLSEVFREIYVSPAPDLIPRLDVLGKLMLVPLGALTFLSLRPLEGTGFRFAVSSDDLLAGVKNFILFLPLGLAIGIGTGFVAWDPQPVEDWTYPFQVLGHMLGIYLAIGLAEELFFRGIIQNLLSFSTGMFWAQVIASVFFGLSHVGARGFPNWRYALLAGVAGWFYGRAYAQRQSVVASAVAHTLVNITWRFMFS